MIERAHALKSQASELHSIAETLSVGESAILHRIANAVWESGKDLELIALAERHSSRRSVA